MTFPSPSTDSVDLTDMALTAVKADEKERERRRRELAQETGYTMLMPGMF